MSKELKPVIKDANECLKEVLEFLPDAKITSDVYPGSTFITIEAFDGSIKLIAPMKVYTYRNASGRAINKPIESISPWLCQVAVDLGKDSVTNVIINVDESSGYSAIVAFKNVRRMFQNRLAIMCNVNENISNVAR